MLPLYPRQGRTRERKTEIGKEKEEQKRRTKGPPSRRKNAGRMEGGIEEGQKRGREGRRRGKVGRKKRREERKEEIEDIDRKSVV